MIFSSKLEENELTNFEHWNNWKPFEELLVNVETKINENFTCGGQKKLKLPRRTSRHNEFGNWFPPLNFKEKNKILNFKRKLGDKQCEDADLKRKKINLAVDDSHRWRKVVNEDWGNRVELHDILKYEDGNMMWGFVSLSAFTSIKLWVNEYNNICGCASGILLKQGSSKKAFITVTNLELIKKILNVANSQWCSLCEAVQQSKACLKMENLKSINCSKNSFLDKLWFFICNRRHFLPKLSMLVKLDGTTKCVKELTVIPKLVVQDIRNEEGLLIL